MQTYPYDSHERYLKTKIDVTKIDLSKILVHNFLHDPFLENMKNFDELKLVLEKNFVGPLLLGEVCRGDILRLVMSNALGHDNHKIKDHSYIDVINHATFP